MFVVSAEIDINLTTYATGVHLFVIKQVVSHGPNVHIADSRDSLVLGYSTTAGRGRKVNSSPWCTDATVREKVVQLKGSLES